ncbi:hypothetical protein HK407_06g11300 [Ordospora pajunii]|uniref:uncharacterized protein n=1 Tax=Ordospora pajunii TaxID=3039483 RepID=UPI0029528BD4|nr:uncharacterized protein HK407_06g11300 [Ordospora pajunii]KAH9411299.1 hypothetical protein HK407_06g11300 [Ordospora pajunii]
MDIEKDISYSECLFEPLERKTFMEMVCLLASFPKANDVECAFCQDSVSIHNLHDMFKVYGCALSCLISHIMHVHETDLSVLFSVEKFIMHKIAKKGVANVLGVLAYRKSTNEMYSEILKDQLIATFKENFVDKTIKINCEQEIESITYRYCKKLGESGIALCTNHLEVLMIMLFRRNESIRFFKVLKKHSITYPIFKLALLLSMSSDSNVSTAALINDFKGYAFVDSTLTQNQINEYLEEHADMLASGIELDEWVSARQKSVYWSECLDVWAANRMHEISAMDNSMLELCVKSKHYEDGWLIYETHSNTNIISTSKVCVLCMNALRDTNDCKWIDRLAVLVESVVGRGEPESICALLESIMHRISELPQNRLASALNAMDGAIDRLSKYQDVVVYMLSAICALCTKCGTPEISSVCMRYARQMYGGWKKNTMKGTFSNHLDKATLEVQNNMLAACNALNDCEGFDEVCNDLARMNIDISKPLCICAYNTHNRNCNCNLSKTNLMAKRSKKPSVFGFLNR